MAQSIRLFQTHITNVFWTKFTLFFGRHRFLHVLGVFIKKDASKRGHFALKSTRIKKILRGTFWEIRHIQIQTYPQTYIEPKYNAFYQKNKVSAHGLVLLVQLS